ncbi:MAG: M13 family metallopeptidase [Gemmatimonadaceae bacterium]
MTLPSSVQTTALRSLRSLIFAALASVTLACAGKTGDTASGDSANSAATKVAARPALDLANFDTTCAACKDFYQYVNGGWIKTAEIPAAYPQYGSAYELQDRNEEELHKILEADAAAAIAKKVETGTAAWKVGTYYASCMDTTAIDKLGIAPLKADFDIIDGIKSSDDLKKAFATLEHHAGLAPWSNGSSQDAKDATSMIVGLGQSGITLPERDYYLKTDTASKRIRDSYVAHIVAMFKLMGDTPENAAAEANTVLAFETSLAKASKPRVELRDPNANYHKMSIAELEKLAPNIPWSTYFSEQGAASSTAVDVGQPEFIKAVNNMVTATPVADWKTVLRWHFVHGLAPSLSTPVVQENFKYGQLFSGAKELLPRWKRCSGSTDARLGELLGQEYVKNAFPPEAKARAVKIVSNLIEELHARIDSLDWMTAPTKAQALAKLRAFTRKIGYPDKWIDYSKLEIKSGEYVANVRAADAFGAARDWAKVGKPVDRAEWGMTPPTVNAYYNPQLNEIVFPAGILQPPFYNPNADDAINYGAMGAIIGHEMTHGFDDQGRQYDKGGNLKDWWTKIDADKYKVEAAKFVKQFDSYTVLDSNTHVNGKLTLGENIADFGGLTVAYAAMKKAQGAAPVAKIDGFTSEQRFFLGFAQAWRSKSRPEYSRMLINADVHSPDKWRANGPLSNMPEFKAAFGCKDTDPMVRPAAERPRIW